jgi:hypothetical protein
MIYSPNHNFLLIKNLKVGGTSLEIDLEKNLPENAIVTPQEPTQPETYIPRNYREHGFSSHSSFNLFKQQLDKINTKNLRSAIFVRNPLDTVLSHFFMAIKFQNIDVKDYKTYVDAYFNNRISTQFLKSTRGLFVDNDYSNNVQVSDVLLYENGIENQINQILKEVGIKEIKLTSNEKSWRPKELTPNDVFNKKQIDMIKKEWRWEIKTFYPELE